MSASVSLPVVTGGIGASVPTTNLGSLKTLVASGVDGIVDIEASGDGVNFISVATIGRGQAEQIISLVCAAMRVNATNGSANSVAVMAQPATALSKVIPTPPTNGPGAAVDVSEFGFLTTILATEPSGGGTVEFQISEDGLNWTTAYQSVAHAKALNAPMLSANFLRAVGNQATAASLTVCGSVPDVPVQPIGPDGVAYGNYICWRPNALDNPGGNVCTTWEEVYALIEKYRPHGQIMLEIDSLDDTRILTYDPGGPNEEDLVGYAEVPAGTWDMDKVVITSLYQKRTTGDFRFSRLTFADNAFWINLTRFQGSVLQVISKSTVSAPIQQHNQGIDMFGGNTEIFCLTATAKPVFQGGTDPGDFFCGLWTDGEHTFNSILGRGEGGAILPSKPALAPAWDIGGTFGVARFGPRGFQSNNIMDSVGTGFLFWNPLVADGENSFIQNVPDANVGFQDAPTFQVQENVREIGFADSPYDTFWGRTLLVDTSGGAVTVNMPKAFAARGQTVTVKDVNGDATANNITVVPAGAETIEDGTIAVDFGCKKWVSDGNGHWAKISG